MVLYGSVTFYYLVAQWKWSVIANMESFHPGIMEHIDRLSEFDRGEVSPARDFDSFAAQVAGWQQRYDLLGGGQFYGYTSDMWLNGIQLYREASSGHLAVSGETWRGSLFFAVPYRAVEPARINGLEVNERDAFVYFGGRDWHIRTPAAWSVLTIAVPEEIWSPFPFIDELQRLARHGAVLRSFFSANSLESFLRGAALLADANFSDAHEPVKRQLEQLAQSVIKAGLKAAFDSDAPWQRYRAYGSAGRQINTLRHLALSAASSQDVLATVDRATYRSLHNHIKTVLDCSPHRYVEAVKLNAARRAFLNGAGAVLDTASSYGFWHGSRFASQYAKLFGERPSETLSRLPAP